MAPVKSLCKHFLLALYAFVLSLGLLLTAPFWIVPYYVTYDKYHARSVGQHKKEPLRPLLEALLTGIYSMLFSGILLLLSPFWVLPYAIMQDQRNSGNI